MIGWGIIEREVLRVLMQLESGSVHAHKQLKHYFTSLYHISISLWVQSLEGVQAPAQLVVLC